MNVFGAGLSTTTLTVLRRHLGIKGMPWCEKAEIRELLRCAFPLLCDGEIGNELKYWLAQGHFRKKPQPPEGIYAVYCREYGCTIPFGTEEQIKTKKELQLRVTEPKAGTTAKYQMEMMDMSELQEAKGALLDVLHQLQDPKSCQNEQGDFDKDKAEQMFKRASAIGEVVGQLTNIQRTQLEAKRAQLEACKLAFDHGYNVRPEAFGVQQIEVKDAQVQG